MADLASTALSFWDQFLTIEPDAAKYIRPNVEAFTWGWRLEFTTEEEVYLYVTINAAGQEMLTSYYACSPDVSLGYGKGDLGEEGLLREMATILDRYFIKKES